MYIVTWGNTVGYNNREEGSIPYVRNPANSIARSYTHGFPLPGPPYLYLDKLGTGREVPSKYPNECLHHSAECSCVV